MSKKTKKDRKPRPQPKPNRQIPNSMIKPIKLFGPRYYLEHAREYPILGCWIMEGWSEAGLAPVVIEREIEPGKILAAVCMVDLYCLGVKDAYAITNMSRSKLESSLSFICAGSPEKISVELAHEIIYGAIEYAASYGFQPHPDFKTLMVDLVLDPPDAHPRLENVAFGKDGKPFYISGPNDDVQRKDFIFNTLMRTAGKDNFDFLIGNDPIDFFDDEDDDDLDLDDLYEDDDLIDLVDDETGDSQEDVV